MFSLILKYTRGVRLLLELLIRIYESTVIFNTGQVDIMYGLRNEPVNMLHDVTMWLNIGVFDIKSCNINAYFWLF